MPLHGVACRVKFTFESLHMSPANITRRMRGARLWLGLSGVLCSVTAGCATPIGQHWANFAEEKKVEAIAADDSFPTAAQMGLPPAEDRTTDEG